MKICFPVEKDSALESEVFGHFGSAPMFILVDSETETAQVILNSGRHHNHGMCNPAGALEGQGVDAVVVSGIGSRALMKLNGAGIRVYKTGGKTIGDDTRLLCSGKLTQVQPGHVCAGHGRDCSH
ncbi:MAG: NifB/NifX family molybdenum-iron cluster-binding protein [Nitrospirae bacterium]|nr:NifB/NifX family molybdenum-iron cluster-binding protein [Nitrospirota bacterium]